MGRARRPGRRRPVPEGAGSPTTTRSRGGAVKRINGQAAGGTSILVLDDRSSDRELLVTVLRYAGYVVHEGPSAEEGLRLARVEVPDLILADVLMTAMSGDEFVRRLRSEPALASIQVAFYTANYDEDELRRIGESCGVSHFLVNPSEPDEIIRVVHAALEPKGAFAPVWVKDFDNDQLRTVNGKLAEKVNQLAAANRELRSLHERVAQAEREATESLTLLDTLQSSAPIGFGFVDREYRMVHLNETLATLNGGFAHEQIGCRVADVVPGLWAKLEPVYRQVLETGEAIVNLEVERADPDAADETRSWLCSYYPVRAAGKVIGIGLVALDITERKEAEALHSVVMENIAEGLYVLDRDGCVTYMNRAATKLLGWTIDELRGKPAHDVIHFQHIDGSAFRAEDCDLLRVRGGGPPLRVDADAFTCKDGTIMPVSYSAAPLGGGEHERGIVVVFRDMTEERAEYARVQRELDALSWVGRIREALDEERFVLYSQPIIPLAGGDGSEELLVRMLGRADEVIAPGAFLPVAEKYGLIGEIDRWVIGQAATLAGRGRRVQANVSPSSLANLDLLSLIERRLCETDADPSNLVIEITETAVMEDVEAGEAFARGLAEIGCSLALDDFGTGFGSFTYLTNLAIDYVKIDIDFVRDLGANQANQHVVKAIVGLGQDFHFKTIAEGVEDAATLALLKEYGVDFAQGFHLQRPAPVDEMRRSGDHRARATA